MIAKNAAPDIDRLVFAVHRNARRHAGDRLPGLMQAVCIDELGPINALDDLLMAGGLTRSKAALRVRYMIKTVDAFLDECVKAGSLVLQDGRFIVSGDLAEALRYLHECRATGASELWGTRADVVEELTADAVKVLAAAGDSPLLAAYHDVPLDDRRDIRLFELLTRLRYLRNDAHADLLEAITRLLSPHVEDEFALFLRTETLAKYKPTTGIQQPLLELSQDLWVGLVGALQVSKAEFGVLDNP